MEDWKITFPLGMNGLFSGAIYAKLPGEYVFLFVPITEDLRQIINKQL